MAIHEPPSGPTVSPATFDSMFKDFTISLRSDSDIRQASIEKDLEADARELSEIDGMPAPPRTLLTGDMLSSSTYSYPITWDATAIEEPTYTSWLAPTPTTVVIPAGTKFIQDPVTGVLTNVDDIEVEI